jgi:hypothetical protein
MSKIAGEVVKLLQLDGPETLSTAAVRSEALETLESGGIIYLPNSGFTLSEQEHILVSDAPITLPTPKERKALGGRPIVVYDPGRRRLLNSRIKIRQPVRSELENLLTRYAQWAEQTIGELFPRYRDGLIRDQTIYRPCERNNPQNLHVDATYGRLSGRAMLRVFCNVNPENQRRVWKIGESFEEFAKRFVPTAKITPPSAMERLVRRAGVTKGHTTYDRLVEDLRTQVQRDKHYQKECPQKTIEWPSGAIWIAMTDLVLHAHISGQQLLDQTFFVPLENMANSEKSSLRILERMTQTKLV